MVLPWMRIFAGVSRLAAWELGASLGDESAYSDAASVLELRIDVRGASRVARKRIAAADALGGADTSFVCADCCFRSGSKFAGSSVCVVGARGNVALVSCIGAKSDFET